MKKLSKFDNETIASFCKDKKVKMPTQKDPMLNVLNTAQTKNIKNDSDLLAQELRSLP